MMNRFVSVCVVAGLTLAASGPCSAQDALAIRIETEKEGLHRIPGEALKGHYPLDRIVPDRLALSHDGQPVPIEIFGASDGHFDPADEIIFFAEAPTNRHSKTETYVLTESGKAARLRPATASPSAAGAVAESKVVGHVSRNSVFSELATVRQDLIRSPMPSPWFTAALQPKGARSKAGAEGAESDPTAASVPAILEPRPLKGLPAKIEVRTFGAMADGVRQKLQVNVNGTDLTAWSWDTPMRATGVITIPPDVLRRENVVRFTNLTDQTSYAEPGNEILSRRRNDLLIEGFSIIYDAQLVGPSVAGQQTVFHLPKVEGTKPRQLKIEQRQKDGYLTVEPRSGRMWRGSIVEIPSDREVTLAVCSLGGAYIPPVMEPLRPTREHLGTGGDYVIVTTTELKPAVTMLAEHRRADGFTPVVVEARELYDAFTNGAFHPAAIQRFLVAASQNWQKKPRYLLLAGDADVDCNFLSTRETVPAWLVMTDYNGMTGTDALHADLDADGLPDIPVGRIPTRTREDFLNVARRIIAIETAPPPGAWRRKITFFAGEGRFGAAVDRLLESQAKSVISEIPAQYDVQMTYGSPTSAWYWPADDFNSELIRCFNQGSLVFTYIGHGSPEAFDHVTSGTEVYPILTSKDVELLANEGRSPVMAIIACSTGRYDDWKRDCLAEKMFLKEGGPIAVIAASRISHPYPNALLGKGICQPFFDSTNRVGDAFRAGTRTMLDSAKNLGTRLLAKQFLSKAVDDQSLIRDHVYIYNLLGDPAQKVPYPAALEAIEAPATAKPGSTIEVKAPVAEGAAGEAVVTIEAGRGSRAATRTDSGPTNAGSGEAADRAAAIKARHAAANDHAIARQRVAVGNDGVVNATLEIPVDTPPGNYAIVVFFAGSGGALDAAGSRKLRIE